MGNKLQIDSNVKLIEQPDGCLSKHYPLTVGNIYRILGWMGSCIVITTDNEGGSASIHPSRVIVA